MKANTYLGKLSIRIGTYENTVLYLVVANSQAAADEEFEHVAASYYGSGEEEMEDDGYYANGGEVHVSAQSLRPIGLATFLEMQSLIPTRCAENVTAPTHAMLSESVHTAATALREALSARLGHAVTQSAMLHALASSWGEKNWQVLKAKLTAQAAVQPQCSNHPD